MPDILDDDIAHPAEMNPADLAVMPHRRFAWENITRCLVIAAVISAIAFMSWRPSMLRFSQLVFMIAPSHGDSLAWKAVDDDIERPAQRIFTSVPDEWRLGSTSYGSWQPTRKTLDRFEFRHEDPLTQPDWERDSFNPWTWQDDAAVQKKRPGVMVAEPDQQPLTSYQAKEDETWTSSSDTTTPVGAEPERVMPTLSPVPLEIPALQPVGGKSVEPVSEKPEPVESRPDLLELPPLSLDEIDLPGLPDFDEEQPEESEAETVQPEPVAVPMGPADEPVDEDWANVEIAEAIPGAYLTIYPKLKFIGLCVPGHGYIRKYNQVAVPGDSDSLKYDAHDGRTPYGKYYIADRGTDDRGAFITLSWPSPEDAVRIGLPADQIEAVENAWLDQILPPQNTAAGGGVALTGDREMVEETDGGFALEQPHMEEIYTALPDGAWVFIQQ